MDIGPIEETKHIELPKRQPAQKPLREPIPRREPAKTPTPSREPVKSPAGPGKEKEKEGGR